MIRPITYEGLFAYEFQDGDADKLTNKLGEVVTNPRYRADALQLDPTRYVCTNCKSEWSREEGDNNAICFNCFSGELVHPEDGAPETPLLRVVKVEPFKSTSDGRTWTTEYVVVAIPVAE